MGGAPLSLPKIRRNPLIEIIPINTGCLNQCTYCKTKHARGDLGSYPPHEVVERAKQAFSGECTEGGGRRVACGINGSDFWIEAMFPTSLIAK